MSDAKLQCTCSTLFKTEVDLQRHLQEYQSRERYLRAELERCRAHSRVGGEDCSDGRDDDQGGSNDDKEYCPGCKLSSPFSRMQGLQRHFRRHVPCDAVCVGCNKSFISVSTFVRHAEILSRPDECDRTHAGLSQKDRDRITETSKALREESDRKLALAINQHPSGIFVGKKLKRRFDGPPARPFAQTVRQVNDGNGQFGSIRNDPSATRRPSKNVVGKRRRHNVAASCPDGPRPPPDFNSTDMAVLGQAIRHISDGNGQFGSICNESLHPLATIMDPVTVSSSSNMPTQFDAPIYGIMNFPPLDDLDDLDNTGTEAAQYHEQ